MQSLRNNRQHDSSYLKNRQTFCKLWVDSVEIGKSVFNWDEMDVARYLVLLNWNEVSVNMMK